MNIFILIFMILLLFMIPLGVVLISVEDTGTKFAGIGIIAVVLIIVFTQISIKIEVFEYGIENIDEIKEVVVRNEYTELEKLYIFFEEDEVLYKQLIADCSVVYGEEYHFQREVKTEMIFGSPVNRSATCELTIQKPDE